MVNGTVAFAEEEFLNPFKQTIRDNIHWLEVLSVQNGLYLGLTPSINSANVLMVVLGWIQKQSCGTSYCELFPMKDHM